MPARIRSLLCLAALAVGMCVVKPLQAAELKLQQVVDLGLLDLASGKANKLYFSNSVYVGAGDDVQLRFLFSGDQVLQLKNSLAAPIGVKLMPYLGSLEVHGHFALSDVHVSLIDPAVRGGVSELNYDATDFSGGNAHIGSFVTPFLQPGAELDLRGVDISFRVKSLPDDLSGGNYMPWFALQTEAGVASLGYSDRVAEIPEGGSVTGVFALLLALGAWCRRGFRRG